MMPPNDDKKGDSIKSARRMPKGQAASADNLTIGNRSFVSELTKVSRRSKTIAAAVLSGGKSSRLGRDKSLLRLDGKTLTALTVLKLMKAGYKPVFVVGPRKAYALARGVEVIAERFRGKGPLSGIESALRKAMGPCLVTPCDLPLISVAAFRRLRSAYAGKTTAFSENPLPAIFPLNTLPRIHRRIEAMRLAVFPLMKNARLIQPPSKRYLINLNDPEALKIVRSYKKVR